VTASIHWLVGGDEGPPGPPGPPGSPAPGAAAGGNPSTSFGLLALPSDPLLATGTARLGDGRMALMWLDLDEGSSVEGIALVLDGLGSGPGSAWGVVYQEDHALLGVTDDLAVALSSGDPFEWRKAALTAAGTVTGAGVWAGYLSTMTANTLAPQLRVVTAVEPHVQNPPWRQRVLRLEGLNAPPPTLDLTGAVPYYDVVLGVYGQPAA
jgi:hypothetical protein